jgi:4-hydroxyphenylpyruvate dioxygenase-like putative hemolysin
MKKLICPECEEVHLHSIDDKCPGCGGTNYKDFKNSDEYLHKEVEVVLEERHKYGLDGLVKGLNNVIINTEPDRQKAAVEELLRYTGLNIAEAFEDSDFRTVVLKTQGSADFLLRSRKKETPFLSLNRFPKSEHVPNTRLETFVFETANVEKYVSIQKQRGIEFLTDDIIDSDNFSFIQTVPSVYTGNSIGIIQWRRNKGRYNSSGSTPLDWQFRKPDDSTVKNIRELDHAATRVRAEDRDTAVIEFMNLTNYKFDFAIYVKVFNSITSVARFSSEDFAMVFTSGISPYIDDEKSGPTEKFVHNYGPRVHHMAFMTEQIEDTVSALKRNGMNFLIDLVGSPQEGLKQIFSSPSENTLLVNEYIHRYGDFDGFFTKSNVTLLTGATSKQ